MNFETELLEATKARWEESRAWSWSNGLPWLVGCNFIPSNAINQLEMWQADTFSPELIDRELGFLAGIGMNSVRVFLHDLAWVQDPKGFLARMEKYLELASARGIGTLFVFFDSVWHPFPQAGKQREPEPGVHNSFWVQSPGVRILRDAALFDKLEPYVTAVVDRFRNDPRIHGWDLWNEPDNANGGSRPSRDIQGGEKEKAKIVLPLLARTFRWVRAAQPVQPLTTGVWIGDWSSNSTLLPLQQFQLEASDVVSFHNYSPLEEVRRCVGHLKRYRRPLLCTEYMARPAGSTFEAILPYFKEERIAAYNWGSISGKSQTIYAWNTWQNPALSEPTPWFHDVFRPDGSPYDPKETQLIRELTKK